MELTKGTKAEIDAKRVELLRELCTGEGLTQSVPVERAEDFRVFGDHDLEVMQHLFDSTLETMPDSPYTAALKNALTPSGGMNLSERRMAFAEKSGSVSARTLMRHEVEGAELFVKFFDIVESQYLRMKEEEASEDAARDADLEILRRRVSDLEQLVLIEMSFLAGKVNALESRLDGDDDGWNSLWPMKEWSQNNPDKLKELLFKIAGRQREALNGLPIE